MDDHSSWQQQGWTEREDSSSILSQRSREHSEVKWNVLIPVLWTIILKLYKVSDSVKFFLCEMKKISQFHIRKEILFAISLQATLRLCRWHLEYSLVSLFRLKIIRVFSFERTALDNDGSCSWFGCVILFWLVFNIFE